MLIPALWAMSTCGETPEGERLARYRGMRCQLLAALAMLSGGERLTLVRGKENSEFLGIGTYKRHITLCELLVNEGLVTEDRESEWVPGMVFFRISQQGLDLLQEAVAWWRSLNPITMLIARIAE